MKFVCLKCDCEDSIETTEPVDQVVFDGKITKTITVNSPITKCASCGWRSLTIDQLDVLWMTVKERLKMSFEHKIEVSRMIYLEGGERIVIRPDTDDLGLVEIADDTSRVTYPPDLARLVAKAIVECAKEIEDAATP